MSVSPVVALEPVRAVTLPAAGRALAEAFAFESAGRLRAALEGFERATVLDPDCGPLWRHRGNLLRKVGELGAAAECFERAIVRGDDRELNRFFLSAVGIGPVVASAPAAFVGALFDQYASRFEDHLLGPLRYRAFEALADLVGQAGKARFGTAIDLGCGTGLAGAAFRPGCDLLVGVDLSAGMLERAARRGIYDTLIHADFVAALEGAAGRFGLVVCCDALIYIGDLEPLFAAVRRVLLPGGSFAFTVEAGEADSGFDLLPSLRYNHSERYLRRLAAQFGFAVAAIRSDTLRVEGDEAVPGLLVHLAAGQQPVEPGSPKTDG